MRPVYLQAVGFAAPGMAGWPAASVVLRGDAPFVPVPLALHAPALLPANERRRAPAAVRLAFQAAEDALRPAAWPAASLATVFASSDADLAIIHRICLALASTPRLISPTEFHNSVHNAAAGYWHIATASHRASTTICAHDGSFAAGLLEACAQVTVEGHDTLLVAFDAPAPEPLHAKRPMSHPAAVALLLTRERGERVLAALSCKLVQEECVTTLEDPVLEAFRTGNPATRSLPLLQRIARGVHGTTLLPAANDNLLAVELSA